MNLAIKKLLLNVQAGLQKELREVNGYYMMLIQCHGHYLAMKKL
jgi:hypothetical protein